MKSFTWEQVKSSRKGHDASGVANPAGFLYVNKGGVFYPIIDDAIEFNGLYYAQREVVIDGAECTISTESLSKVLMNEEGSNYVSQTAQAIDETIYFYVPDEIIILSDKKIKDCVLESEKEPADSELPKQIGTIDITPTWVSLLPIMLELNAKYVNADVDEYTDEMRKHHKIMEDNFMRMATAADAWIQFTKTEIDLPTEEIVIASSIHNAVLAAPDGWKRYTPNDHEVADLDINWEDEDEVIGVLLSDNNEAIAMHKSGRYSTNFIGTPCYGTFAECESFIIANR